MVPPRLAQVEVCLLMKVLAASMQKQQKVQMLASVNQSWASLIAAAFVPQHLVVLVLPSGLESAQVFAET
jgi:hypothetical protein